MSTVDFSPIITAIAQGGAGVAVLVAVLGNGLLFWLLREERAARSADNKRSADAMDKMAGAVEGLSKTLTELRITIALTRGNGGNGV